MRPGRGRGRWGCCVLTSHLLASLCLSPVDLITSSAQGLRGLVGWVHGHAASCGALPSLQSTLPSEYCGVVQAVWGCGQGHGYTMDAGSRCGALLLDGALGVKWTWDKEKAPWLSQHRGASPTGAAPQSSQGRVTAAGTEMPPTTDTARPPSDGDPVGPGPGPPPEPSLPPSGAPGRRRLWAVRPEPLSWDAACPSRHWLWCRVRRGWGVTGTASAPLPASDGGSGPRSSASCAVECVCARLSSPPAGA